MSNEIEQEPNVAKAHQEVATRNAQVAVKIASETKVSVHEKIKALEAMVINHHAEIQQLQHKYNLLLTKQFNGGSTSGD